MIAISVLLLLFTVAKGVNICKLRGTTIPNGVITSPNYPYNYPTDQKCTFIITAPIGKSIKISFQAMDLEKAEDEDECYDTIEITDMDLLVSNKVSKYCGTKLPKDFISQGNKVKIYFESDYSDLDPKPTGFRLTYEFISNIAGQSVCPNRAFIGNKEGGYISSPNYPLDYGNNLNCKFTLLVPSGKKTNIEFVEMDIEFDQRCSHDSLNISSTSASRIICGTGKPKGSAFYGHKVYFHFLTNTRKTNKGFAIKYHFSDDETKKDDCVCPRGNSYIRVDLTKKKLIRHTDDIRFEFKTTQSNSLLLYAMGRHRDFLRIKLVQGQLRFSVDLGTGKGSITVPTARLNNNRWHFIEITRTGRRARVTVDRSYSGVVETPGIFTKLDLRAPNAFMFVAGSSRSRHGPNFVGCLKNFVIDNRRPIVEAIRGDPAHTMYFNPFPRCPAA